MAIPVEPHDGPELDRLITALLNVTGVVKHAIDDALEHAGGNGIEAIDAAAERLRGPLSILAEHHSDEELAAAVELLADTTVIAAADLGLGSAFVDPP